MAPPAFLLSNIKGKIDEADVIDLKNVFAPLYSHSAMPASISFEQIMLKIKATEPTNVLQQLKNHEVESPISFAKIMERLRALGYFGAANTPAKVISFNNTFKKLAAAAAILLFMVSSYFVYNKFNDSKIEEGNFASTTPPSTPSTNAVTVPIITPNVDTVLQKKDAAITTRNELVVSKSKKENNYTYNKEIGKDNVRAIKYSNTYTTKTVTPKQKTILINGEKFPIYENDYLLTFASFSPNNLPSFLQVETPVETQITIDKYSYFNITDGMGAMMKKMYATKKDSITPTRSARRQKTKLEKWKIADSAYFNQNSNLNPLDPRDLGNLILKK